MIGNLTAGVRYQARIARYREQRAQHLYEMSKSLSQALTPEAIAQTSRHFISSQSARANRHSAAAGKWRTGAARRRGHRHRGGRRDRPLEF